MKTVKAALHGVLWIIAILLQIVVGFVTGYIFFAEGYGDLVFMWLGITLGVFGIGLLSLFSARHFSPKNILYVSGSADYARLCP